MNNLWEGTRFQSLFFEIANDPNQTEKVFDLAEVMLMSGDPRMRRLIEDRAFSNPQLSALYEMRYLPPAPDLDELLQLPEETLGRKFAEHMKKYNLKVDFYRKVELSSPLHYIILRGRQTHDIWHVLTGYDTSKIDEFALQSFTVAQNHSSLSATLVASGILNVLKHNIDQLPYLFDRCVEGYERGRKAKYLLGVPWEDRWEESLHDLREEVGLTYGRTH